MWSQGRVTALAASKYCWEKPDRNGETIWWVDGKGTFIQCQLFGYFFLQMPCNTPVLLPPLACVLCSKIDSLFGHSLLCLTEGHPKRSLFGRPQRAPLSQTLIGERFHQALRRNSPLAEVSREYHQRVMRENEQPCPARGWSQLVTPRAPRTIFPCDRGRSHHRSQNAQMSAGKFQVLKWGCSD